MQLKYWESFKKTKHIIFKRKILPKLILSLMTQNGFDPKILSFEYFAMEQK